MKPITFSLIVLTALAILVTGASASVLSIGNGEVTAIGSTASVNIVLDEAPAGLAGYSFNVSVENPAIATVSAVSYPSWASITQTSTLPSANCWVKASDMGEAVQSGALNTTLATITLQGLAGGATTVNLAVNMMNDDTDAVIVPTIAAGTFTVNVPVVTPEAAFTSDVQTGTVPLTVAFTDQSENVPTSWAWDFGDTGTSTAQSPSHQYTAAGTYTVTLTATNIAGSDAEVKTGYIVVLPLPPVANFNKNVSGGQAPLSVQFTDQSTNSPTSWAWDFQNNGTIDSTEQNPVFVYTAAGSYSINLTASNAGGSNYRLKENNIVVTDTPAPVAGFTATPLTGTAPLTVTFTDSSTNTPTSWAWTFGDGATSTDQNPVHQYTTAGNYTVNLTATNAAGPGSEEKTDYIIVSAAPVIAPVADFTVSPNTPTTGTVPLFVRFTDLSTNEPTSWAWDFGDGGTSTDQNATHTYMAAGTYTVNLTATNAAGSNPMVKTGLVTVAAGSGNGGLANTPWPKSGHDINNTGLSPYTGPQVNAIKWIFSSPYQGVSYGGPAIGSDGTIYFGIGATTTSSGNLTALYPNGTVRWVHVGQNLNRAVYSTPAIGSDGIIYYGEYYASGTCYFYAVNPDGTEKWRDSTGGAIYSSPAIGTDGTIYVTRYDKKLYAFNPDGTIKWSSAARTGTYYYLSPAIGTDGTIYAGNGDKNLTAFNPGDGSVKWSSTTDGAIYGSPVIGPDGTIYVANQGSTYKFTAFNSDGTIKWQNTTVGSIYGSAAIGPDGSIYVGSTDTKVYAFSPGGAPKWVTVTGGAIRGSPVIGGDGTIYIGNYGDAKLYALNPDSGAEKWTYQLQASNGRILGSPAIAPDGTLYVGLWQGTYAQGTVVNTLFAFHDPDSPPVAAFTSDVQSGTAPLTVNFTDQSTNAPTSWAWTFGDGGSSTDQNPVHQYTATGNYTVNLTATNAAGSDSEEKTSYITVSAATVAPVAAFTSDVQSGTAPLMVTFTDQSTNTPTSWLWDFGDGDATNATHQNPIHTYAAAGTYTVNLTATNADGSDSEVKTDYINVTAPPIGVPVASFTSDFQNGMVPLTVHFTDQSTNVPTSWLWDFGDGSNSTDQNATHTYTAVGTYTVSLTATNLVGSDTETKAGYITASPATIIGDWTFESGTVEGFAPVSTWGGGMTQSVSTSAHTGSYALQCDANNGIGYARTSVLNPPNSTNYKMEYWVWSSAAGYGYTDVGIQVVDSTGALIAKIDGSDNDIRDTDHNVMLAYRPAGVWLRHLVQWNKDTGVIDHNVFAENGTALCSSQITRAATVGKIPAEVQAHVRGLTVAHTIRYDDIRFSSDSVGWVAPVAAFTSDVQSGIVPLTVNFTDQSTNTPAFWLWTFGDGSNSTAQNPVHQYTVDGTYTVNLTVTNPAGSDSEEKTGYITSTTIAPVAGFTSDVQSGTAPLTVTFTDQSTNTPTSWAWTFGDGATSTDQNPVHQYTAGGNYTVNLTATNAAGSGFEEKTDYIIVAPVIAPVADFTVSATDGVVPLFVRFTDLSTNEPTSWAWDFGDGGTSTDQNATHTYMAEGTYTVTLTATNTAGSNSTVKTGLITVTAGSGSGGLANTAWPKFGHDLQNTGRSPYVGAQTATVKWSYSAGNFTRNSPVVGSDGTIYIANYGNRNFYALNPDGTVKWTYPLNGSSYGGSPAIAADGILYISESTNNKLFALNPDGTERWNFSAGGSIRSSPAIGTDGTIYIGTYSTSKLWALNPDRTEKWNLTLGSIFMGSPAIGTDGTIYVGTYSDKKVYAINPEGTQKWSFTTGGAIWSQPTIGTDGTIYAGSNDDKKLWALNPDGTEKWNRSVIERIVGGPSIGPDGTIYIGNNYANGKLWAMNPDGTQKWTYTTTAMINTNPAIGADGTIYFGTFSSARAPTRNFYALNPDGTEKWKFTLGTNTMAADMQGSPAIGPDGTVYAATTGGILYAFHDPAAPVADFLSDIQSGTAPLTVHFADDSANTPTSWLWDFGDGDSTNSTVKNPVHTYAAAGIYNVTLTATNAGGSDTETKAGYITVNRAPTPPVAAFTVNATSGIAPLAIKFSDLSTNLPTSWSWSFSDGGTSTDQDPVYIFASPGTYTVTLTATNADGSDSEVKTNFIQVLDPSQPTVLVVPQTMEVAPGSTNVYAISINTLPSGLAGYNLSVSLADANIGEIMALTLPSWASLNSSSATPADSVWFSGLDLARSVEAGATNVPLGTVMLRGDALGSTAVVVVVSEMDADGGGLITPAVVPAVLNVYQPVPVVADFTADNTSGYFPLTVKFTDLSTGVPVPSSWNWNFGDGATSTQRNPTHTYSQPGLYNVSLTVANVNGQDSITKAGYITVMRHVVQFPGCVNEPLDPDHDGRYEDINGNGRLDFHDVVTLYQNMQWVRDNTEVGTDPFDFNGNGRLDYDDVVLLYYEVLAD